MAMTQMLMAGAEGEAPIFPSAYQTLIDGYSAGNTRYYDIANGNDSNNSLKNSPKCLLTTKKDEKISRNERCLATGKKFKNCCGVL